MSCSIEGLNSSAYFERLRFAQKKRFAVLRALLGAFGKFSNVRFRFPEVLAQNLYGSSEEVISTLLSYYEYSFALQAVRAVGTLDIIGSPEHLIERLGDAFVRFGTETPSEILQHGCGKNSAVAARDSSAALIAALVAAPIEAAGRVTGALTSVVEGLVGPAGHMAQRTAGMPLRGVTWVLDGTANTISRLDTNFQLGHRVRPARHVDSTGHFVCLDVDNSGICSTAGGHAATPSAREDFDAAVERGGELILDIGEQGLGNDEIEENKLDSFHTCTCCIVG